MESLHSNKMEAASIGELTSKIKLHSRPMSVEEALHSARLVRKNFEVPLVSRGDTPLLIGRDDRLVTLVINDPFISRTHAAVIHEDKDFFIQDLYSKNGTYINNRRLPPGQRSDQPLKNGDHIRFNTVEFEFVVPEKSI
jgi:pSer/pThr/pTyr-binding forkhead associated (FHA) protein